MDRPPVLRFAPSPTGRMHVGNARTALYNWLWAKHTGGRMLLRIEDTDPERSTDENISFIFDALNWLGLDHDGDVVRQTSNEERHRALVQDLLDRGLAYHSTAVKDDVDAFKREHGHDRGFRGEPQAAGAVRLHVPDDGVTVVPDLIRGDTTFENYRFDDPVIARADGSPLYNFAVAVDDADMGVTQVIRGEDHLSNTPRQLLVLNALGLPAPTYAHLPLLHGTDGKKLGKRNGAKSVQELRAEGFLPEAVTNYLTLLSWGGADEEQCLGLDDLAAIFDLHTVTHTSAQFNEKKLRWMNGHWVRHLPVYDLADRLRHHTGRQNDLTAAVLASREKFQTLDEFWPLVAGIYDGVQDDPKAWAKFMTRPEASSCLQACRDALASTTTWDIPSVDAALHGVPDSLGLSAGRVFQPLRVALTGSSISPGIADTVCLLSRTLVLDRIDAALDHISRETAAAGESEGNDRQDAPAGLTP